MDGAAIAVAALAGLAAGALAAPAADAIATPRYAPGAPGHDPEDLDLAPLAAPTPPAARVVAALVGAAAFALAATTSSFTSVVVTLCVLAWLCLVGSLIDLQYLRLPNVLTLGGAVVTLGLVVASSIRIDLEDAITGAVVGGLAYAIFLFVIAELFRAISGRSGLGLGDVKLALSLGLTAGWLGWRPDLQVLGPIRAVIVAALIGNLLGAVGGLLLTRLQPRRSYPFGPFLAAGWLIAVVVV